MTPCHRRSLFVFLTLALLSTEIPVVSSFTIVGTTRSGRTPIDPLSAKKSSSTTSTSSSSSSSSSSSRHVKQVQVKLLKHVAGTGQAGDVVLVNPSFFNNKLRPQKAATIISKHEVEQQVASAEEQAERIQHQAQAWQEVLQGGSTNNDDDDDDGADDDSNGYVLRLTNNKTGPDGHKLFGGIGVKKLWQELLSDAQKRWKDDNELDVGFLESSKQVKIIDVVDDVSGETLTGDIKTTGTFQMKILLLSRHPAGGPTKGKRRNARVFDDDEEDVVATVRVEVEGSAS